MDGDLHRRVGAQFLGFGERVFEGEDDCVKLGTLGSGGRSGREAVSGGCAVAGFVYHDNGGGAVAAGMAAGAVGVEVHGVRHGEGDRSWYLC